MKSFFAIVLIAFLSVSAYGQSNSRYQTYKSVMNVMASKNGIVEQWKNENLSVVLDYKTGEFLLKMTNYDFYKNSTTTAEEDPNQQRLEYTLQGIFPLRDIINQQNISQNYVVELQIINYDLGLNQTLRFDLNVTNPGTTQKNYRIFMLQGKMYNNEVNLPGFVGYDNEIELHFGFNGIMVQQ